MSVYDRWHRAPAPGLEPCRCGRGKTPLYPSAAHLKGDRWQVRWYDPDTEKQRKRSFPAREGRDPARHADAFDVKIRREIDTGDYMDPDAANVSFEAYAAEHVKILARDPVSLQRMEGTFRRHVYPVIGRYPLRKLSKQPTLTQEWIRGLEAKLAPSTARQLVTDVSGIYIAAVADGIIARNPCKASSVTRPKPAPRKARAWSAEKVAAMTAALEARYSVIPVLGAGTGMRQGELFGLAVEDITFLSRDPQVAVVRQVKYARGQRCFAPPKCRKTREVPLAPEIAAALARHMELFPPREVTLPWWDPRDRLRHLKPVTVRLVLTSPRGGPVANTWFNRGYWHPAQEAAGITPKLAKGEKRAPAWADGMHALRHTYASFQLAAGAGVTDVASWMGDTPKMVLETYAHFMPGREDKGRAAVSAFFAGEISQNVPSVPVTSTS